MRRYELVWMGSIAAVAGIGLAALLTASFGARSSGAPPGLRPAAAATAVPAEPAAAKRVPVRVHAARKHAAHRRHRRVRDHAPTAKPARSIPTTARTESPQPAQPIAVSQPTRTVASPAPAPKHSSPSGVSFDDSG